MSPGRGRAGAVLGGATLSPGAAKPRAETDTATDVTDRNPRYDRSKLSAGIVHIGLGNFHRAHMAVYLDDLFNLGESHDWAIIGAGVRAPDSRMRDALKGQDCLSTIIELDPQGKTCRRVGAMIDFLPVEPDNASLIAAMSDPQIRIVSLTVTEGGYFVNPATGKFDLTAPEIVVDGKTPAAPATAFGAIVAALKARRAAGIPPFTVMSCDNLPGNGHVTHDAVIGTARLSDPELAAWIEANVAFPNGMVDRITGVLVLPQRIPCGRRQCLNPDMAWCLTQETPLGISDVERL